MDTHEATIYTAVLITAVVIGGIIFYFFISVFRQQRKHLAFQRIYFLNEIGLLEKERTRIARDLHDELGPTLAMAQINMKQLEKYSEEDRKYWNNASKSIDTVINRLGEIAADLRPRILVSKGLQFALEDFACNFQEAANMNLQFFYEAKTSIDQNISIHIYRIVQELMHNALKHSKGSEIEIRLKERKGVLYIFYKDNGAGFQEENELQAEKGIGLKSLKSRTGMMGGKIKCTTAPGKGTEYFFEIPLKQADAANY